jgi:hypothetical protein
MHTLINKAKYSFFALFLSGSLHVIASEGLEKTVFTHKDLQHKLIKNTKDYSKKNNKEKYIKEELQRTQEKKEMLLEIKKELGKEKKAANQYLQNTQAKLTAVRAEELAAQMVAINRQ